MKKIFTFFIFIILIFCLIIPIRATATINDDNSDQKYKIEETTPINKFIVQKLERKNILEEIKSQESELTIKKEKFSDFIEIEVTKEQKENINSQLLNLENEIKMLAKLIYREARGIKSTEQKAAVVWCVLNRVDNGNYGKSIKEVITAKHQFAWVPDTPVQDEFLNLSKDVVSRWLLEKEGIQKVGRVLPKDYLFFAGRNGKNYFRQNYKSKTYWDWSLESPYVEVIQEDD